VIVEKSTVPVYTNDGFRRFVERNGTSSTNFDVASNPEFLREGTAVSDFLHPDRSCRRGQRTGSQYPQGIYAPLTSGAYYRSATPSSVIHNLRSATAADESTKAAELIKHASNAFSCDEDSFINAVASVCEAVDANVKRWRAGGAGQAHWQPVRARASGMEAPASPKMWRLFATSLNN